MSYPARVEAGLAAEFPGLAIEARRCSGPATPEPGVGERLDLIAGRIRGATAIEMRREPVPAAYRALYRQLGLDPDAELPPAEAAVARRLFDGGVKPSGPLAAALELAVLESSVPVYAFDAAALVGGLVVRIVEPGEDVTGADGVARTGPGRIVVADEEGPVSWLFEEAHGRGSADDGTRSLVLMAIGAPGVPGISLDEALETAAGAIGA